MSGYSPNSGTHSGLSPQVTIVRTLPNWQSLWTQHGSYMLPPPPLPAVDFGTEMVVVVVREFFTNGSSVQIDQLEAQPSAIEVTFTVNQCSGMLPVVIQPHHMVTAPQTPGSVVENEIITTICP